MLNRHFVGKHLKVIKHSLLSDFLLLQIVADGLALLLRRPWDPAAKSITKSKLEQLPGNPVIIVAPPGKDLNIVLIDCSFLYK